MDYHSVMFKKRAYQMKKSFTGGNPRIAALAAFFTNGALMAAWVSRIPTIQIKLNLSEGALGVILFGMSAGALAFLSLAGGLIARFSSRKVTTAGAAAMCLLLPILALAPNQIALFIALFAFGGAMSLMDVAMNDQAVLVERSTGRLLMSSFHAAYSIGGLAGALVSAGMALVPAVTPLIHFSIVTVFFVITTFLFSSHLVPAENEARNKEAVFRLPERALWGLGIIAFCSVITEGAMADWSGVYLTRVLKTDAAFAALGYAAFSLAMTIGRVFGDYLTANLKPVNIVRFGGLTAALGLLLGVTTSNPVLALAGFAAVGMGLSNIIPLSFSAAGNLPGISTGAGIAGVATFGYAGLLVGPPFIGLVAENTSLRTALIFIALLVATLIFTARAVSTPKNTDG